MVRTCFTMSPCKSSHTLAGVAINTIEARPTVLARITVALLSVCKKNMKTGHSAKDKVSLNITGKYERMLACCHTSVEANVLKAVLHVSTYIFIKQTYIN